MQADCIRPSHTIVVLAGQCFDRWFPEPWHRVLRIRVASVGKMDGMCLNMTSLACCAASKKEVLALTISYVVFDVFFTGKPE